MDARRRAAVARGCVAAAGFAGLTAWWLWPLPLHVFDHSAYLLGRARGVTADFHLLVWILAWDAHALATAPWRIFDANAFHPSPSSLAFSEHLFGLVPLFAPWYWATDNPIFAANMTIVTVQVLSACAVYALARRFSPAPAAVVAAVLFAFAPFRARMLPYFHLLAVQWLPLVLLFSERWLDAARRRDLVLLTLALVLQTLTSMYLAYVVFLAYGTFLGVSLWLRRRELDVRRLAGLAAAAGVALGILAAASVPYFSLRALGVLRSYEDLAPGQRLTLGLRPYFARQVVEAYLASGAVGLLGAALVVLGIWRPPADRRRIVVVAVALVAVGLLVSLGPGILVAGHVLWSPYRLLQEWVPGFASVRLPARLLVITHLGLALLAGFGTARVLELARLRHARAWAATVGLLVLLFATSIRVPALPLHEEAAGAPPEPHLDWLARHGAGRPLLELPRPDFVGAARRMVMSTRHWLPIVDGYSGYAPRTSAYLHDIARKLPDPDALQRLVDVVDLGWITIPQGRTSWTRSSSSSAIVRSPTAACSRSRPRSRSCGERARPTAVLSGRSR